MIARLTFGAVLGVLIAFPPLLDIALAVGTAVASQPPALAFAAGVILWPRIARRARKWWTT